MKWKIKKVFESSEEMYKGAGRKKPQIE